MTNGVQFAFQKFYGEYRTRFRPSPEQDKAAFAIMNCKTGRLGANVCICDKCGYLEYHHNSCRNRNCPSCQAIPREVWIDNRNSEVIGASYFHVVFTVPYELNGLFYANQSLLYPLFHKAVSETLVLLAQNKKFLGAVPGIIQVFHSWGQELNYHPHIHCIVTGAGLTGDMRFVKGRDNFFIPVRILSKVFRGKFIGKLRKLFDSGGLLFPQRFPQLKSPAELADFIKKLYCNDWVPFIKETFKNFGNAIEYLGRYTHRIAISNSRVVAVSADTVSFSAMDYRDGSKNIITIPGVEFIRRFLSHVLPKGFQKIRYSGFLNNRFKSRNLRLICCATGEELSKRRFEGFGVADIILTLWGININMCPACNSESLKMRGISFMRC